MHGHLTGTDHNALHGLTAAGIGDSDHIANCAVLERFDLGGDVDARKLNDQDAELLLRRAVALGLATDFSGMQFLRDRFGAAMEKSKQGASFKAVAGGKLLKARNFAALARRAAELDTFRAFMKTLSQRRIKAEAGQTAALN